MGIFAKPLCIVTKQSFHQLVPIVLCEMAHVANEHPDREAKKATQVLVPYKTCVRINLALQIIFVSDVLSQKALV